MFFKKQTRSKTFCFLLLTVFILNLTLISADSPTISSISTSIQKYQPAKGSILGGTTVYIKGSGFSLQASQNSILIGNFPCIAKNQGVSRQDMLVCQTTAASFSAYLSTKVTVVQEDGTSLSVTCSLNDCKFEYVSYLTPLLYEINPRTAHGDQQIKIWGLHRITDSGDGRSATEGQVKNLMIDDVTCSLIDVVQSDQINPDSRDVVQCNVFKDQDAGQYDFTQSVITGKMRNSIRTSQTSLFTGKNYTQRIAAQVTDMPYHEGGSLGQQIRLKGTGFSQDISNFKCTVAGQQCQVIDSQVTSITVKIPVHDPLNTDFGALQADSSDTQNQEGKYLGSNGFKYTKYETPNIWKTAQNWIQFLRGSGPNTLKKQEKLVTQISSTEGISQMAVQYWRGYFVAPTAGVYRFAGMADDKFIVQLSKVQNSSKIENLQTLIYQEEYTNQHFLPYWAGDSNTQSNITLNAGYYYMEAASINTGGGGFFKVIVDIPENGDTINPTWQVDKVQILQTNMEPEIITVTVNNTAMVASSKTKFELYYQTVTNGVVNLFLQEFDLGVSAAGFQNQLKDSNMSALSKFNHIVTLQTLTDITDSSVITSYIYTISIQNYRATATLPLTRTSSVKIARIQNHSAPINGTYSLKIGSELLSVWNDKLWRQSTDILYNVNLWHITNALNKYYKSQQITVTQLKGSSNVNLITYFIQYVGVLGVPQPITINTTLLSGGPDNAFTQTASTVRWYSNRPLYSPIPYEFLRTAESDPQIYLTTNQIPILCKDCSYSYDQLLNAVVNSASLSTHTYTLSLTDAGNVGFGLSDVSVYLLGVQCKTLIGTLLSFTCTFDANSAGDAALPAGSSKPQIHIAQIGYAQVSSLTPQSVSMTVSSLSLGVTGTNGEIQATLIGRGFPLDKNDDLSIVLCGNQVTDFISVSNEQIVFTVPKATTACSGSTTSKVSFAGQDVSLTFNYDDSVTPQISALSTHSASPILKGSITITGTKFTTQPNTKVFLTQNGVKKYQLGITSFSTTQIVCALGGGKTGTYNLQVFDKTTGASTISTNSQLRYEIIVESVSPTSGGLGGGYDLTITGKNFAAADSHTVFVGDAMNSICQIKSATSTSIVCTVPRMDSSYATNTPLGVVVTGRILQESICNGTCDFTFDPNSTKTNYVIAPSVLAYDAGATVTILGDSVKGTNLAGAIVEVGGIIVSSTSTASSVTFTYPALGSGKYSIQIKTSLGYQYPGIQTSTSMKLADTISSSTGSSQGHIITVRGNGLASIKTDSKLKVYSVCSGSIKELQVVRAVPNEISFKNKPMDATNFACRFNVTYGTFFKHYSYAYEFAKTPAVSITQNAGVYTATKTNLTAMTFDTVTFEYLDSDGTPTTSVYPGIVTTSGSSFTIAPAGGYLPSGQFTIRVHSNVYGYAVVTPSTFTKSWSSNPTATPVSSSFVGGQTLTLSGQGFITSQPKNNEIHVCGIRAQIVSATTLGLTLVVPPLVTIQTQSIYNLAESSVISGTLISDTPSNAPFVIDGVIKSVYSSANQLCYIGLSFGSNAFANISSIKYMPNPAWPTPADKLQGALFQGSNDSTTWTTIFQVDTSQVHSGWNYWIPSQLVQYKFVRFSHNSDSGCQLSDFIFEGIVYSTSPVTNGTNKQCDVVIQAPTTDITISNAVTYNHSATSVITKISPPFGSSAGGDTITIQGTNFGSSITVTIDGVDCSVIINNSTQIKCRSAYRASAPASGNSFIVVSNGNSVLLRSEPFLYIDRWSEQATWGGETLPRQGDSVYVPKGMTLLVDVASTPILDTIIVEGKIKFSDQIDMTLDAHYFLINRGQFQAGTQKNRYKKKLTITLHGGYYDKQLPIFGNKVLGCRNCKFSLHGKERTPTWTLTAATINIGDTSLTTIEPVDWIVGQKIVIAATSYDHYQSEQKTITAVSADKKTITVKQPFKFRHFSQVQTHAGTQFVMRAEVGLLTRNIKIQGNNQSIADRYGSHMMMNGKRDQGLVASFSYAEFTNCGQTSIIGRYCTHFHMTGQMPESSVRGIAVHHSFARVLTIHGTHFLLVQKNVGYHVQGHNIFIQDGIQTNNVIQDNLLISSITSLTLTQSDITVASIWVTNPYNTVRRNHAAGGDFYGIWYQINDHPTGPSATSDICPMGMPLGISRDNVAHSNIRFGLRIFKLRSSKYPCDPISDQSLQDPYTANVPILSTFDNYTLWKNKQCGFLGQQLGYTTINNFKTIDSLKGGMQFHKTNFTKQLVIAQNSVVVGFSNGNRPLSLDQLNAEYNNARGLIASRTDGLKVSNLTFVNFGPTMTPLQSCSQCYHFKLWVVGSKTTQFQKIKYVNITGNYIFWQLWRRQVFIDLDGTLLKPLVDTHLPAIPAQLSGSVSPYRPSLRVPDHCYRITGPSWNQSIYCDSTISLRSILFTNAIPQVDFYAIDIKAHLLKTPYDNFSQITPALTDDDFSQQYMIVIKKQSMDIKTSWAMPFAVNNYYNIHWKLGIDFTHLAIAPSRLWNQTEGLVLRFNYTDNRQLYQIGKWYKQQLQKEDTETGYIQASLSVPNPSTCLNGEYFNDADRKYLFVCVSGRNKKIRQWIDVNGIRCLNFCPQVPRGPEKQNFSRLWSNLTASQWNLTDENNSPRLPRAGQNVTIPYQWNLVLDVDPPVLNYVQVRGDLIFDRSRDNKFQAHYIWVSQGNITIGSQGAPFKQKAQIILHGQKDDNYLVIDQNASGNKMLVNTGGLKFFGNPPANVWTKLEKTAIVGSTSITVLDDITDWKVGDKIVIAPSYDGQKQFQEVTIVTISGKTITFTPDLDYQHFGAAEATIKNGYGVLDARAAVGLLTRNIRITNASDANGWGCRVLNYGYLQLPLGGGEVMLRNGYMQWNGVQLDGCGQYDTSYAGLRIDRVGFHSPSNLSADVRAAYDGYPITQVNKSSIHACYGMCAWISDSKNVSLNNNVFFWARKFLVYVQNVDQYSFTNNLLIGARKRDQLEKILALTMLPDDVAGYQQYKPIDFKNGQVKVSNNLVQGSQGEGFVFPFTSCDLLNTYNFYDNTAGSCLVGFAFNVYSGQTCLAASKFAAYACQIGLMAHPPGMHQRLIYEDAMFADNQRGITLRFAHQIDDNTMVLRNSYFTGISRPNCPTCYNSKKLSYCNGGYAIRMFAATIGGQTFPLVKKITGFDVICNQESFDFKSYFNNVTFQNYVHTNAMVPNCRHMGVFKRHDGASDGVASVYLTNSPCKNCQKEAWGKFKQPSTGWRGWFGGCGQLDCTGPNNYIIDDQDGSFTETGEHTQILANNSWIGDGQNCTAIPEINGHHCKMQDLAVLEYESIAPDFNLRIMWPIKLYYDGGNWTSVTNGWRQWQWDGPQPMNRRLARFWSVVKLGKTYNLTYASQPPLDSRFQIQKRLDPTGNPDDWAIFRIYYPLPNSIEVLVKNTTGKDIIVKPFPIRQNNPVNLTQYKDVCGANTFHYQNGTIQFVVNGVQNCQVRVRLSSFIQLSARISIPIADFYSNNGATTFITNICAFLGIDTGRLKIVGVKSGSTDISALIQAQAVSLDTSTTAPTVSAAATQAQLQTLANSVVVGMQTGTINVGGPLVSVSSSVVVINSDGSVYSGQEQQSDMMLIIILAVAIPCVVIAVTVGVVCYLKRKRERVSSAQSVSEQSLNSNELKQYKRETMKVSQVPFELTKMQDTWYHK